MGALDRQRSILAGESPLDASEAAESWQSRLERTALVPVTGTSRGYYLWVAFLLLIIAWGVYAYSRQLQDGLIVTGMRDRISWGLYITTFVFFIGISHAGTLISAILRVSQARWRTPVTRMAEFITAVALICGALFVIIDLGRPDRLLNVIIYGRWQSPIRASARREARQRASARREARLVSSRVECVGAYAPKWVRGATLPSMKTHHFASLLLRKGAPILLYERGPGGPAQVGATSDDDCPIR